MQLRSVEQAVFILQAVKVYNNHIKGPISVFRKSYVKLVGFATCHRFKLPESSLLGYLSWNWSGQVKLKGLDWSGLANIGHFNS